MILTVCNLKGGTAKTTTAAFLAHALHERGRRVLAVDADPQRSLLRWASMVPDWPFEVTEWSGAGRHALDEGDVVIDTPPTQHASVTVERAVAASSHVLVPMGPTSAEYERMAVLGELLGDVRPAGLVVVVLLVKTVPMASATEVYRQALTEDGWRVLRPVVGRLERFAQAFGGPVERAMSTAYGDAVAELRPSPLPLVREVSV